MRCWRSGLTVAIGLAIAIAAGCYNPPKPECGFSCGPAAACPEDYQCNAADGRCHRTGTPATLACERLVDASVELGDAPLEAGDQQRPRVIQRSPAPGATNIGVTDSVLVTFSEDVLNVSGTTLHVEQGATTVPGTVTYASSAHLAVWAPSAQLWANTSYTVTVVPSIVDLAGNPLMTGETWTFTTGADQVAPSVQSVMPPNDQHGVAVDRQLVVVFDEVVTNVTSSTFTLAAAGAPIAGSVAVMMGGRMAVFTPDRQLPANTLLTAALAPTIGDLAGNPLVPVPWSFTTGPDLVPPQVTSRTPASSATNVSVNAPVTVTFDEPVTNLDATTFRVLDGSAQIAGTITMTNGGQTGTLTPASPLPAATQISVMLSAISDAAGNQSSTMLYEFTTAP